MSEPHPSAARKCPICGKPQDPALRPFCSKRCAHLDLGRWLKGAYVIPGDAVEDQGLPESAPPGSREDEV